jgi:alkylation response protein AidB-like acyl-CoA dehydrogenase
MDLNDTPGQAAYRAEVRAWIDAHRAQAPVLAGSGALGDPDERVIAHRGWQRKLALAGYAGITWPREVGGQGLGPVEQIIIDQELSRAGLPGVLDHFGLGMIGQTIIACGTEAQKRRHLPPTLVADEVWCQLFSEPGAGSDLAGIHTRATQREDGRWVVNGQKVWTSNAQFAAFGLMLARTDPGMPKHRGLTVFIVPIDSAGITIRPIRQISGEAEFNEVFFDDVILEPDAAVGGVGNGWRTAVTTLMFERFTAGFEAERLGFSADRYARAIAGTTTARMSEDVRQRLGVVATELLAVRFGGYRLLTQIMSGGTPGPEAALGKITMVNAGLAGNELVVDVLGLDALAPDGDWHHVVSYFPGMQLAGGSEDILRNTVGERVLGLPPEPRVDKDLPFNELGGRDRGPGEERGS